MNVLSLFDGMSCGRIALERAGIKVDKYYASEIDKYAIQVSQANYQDTIQLGDINELKYDNGTLYTGYHKETDVNYKKAYSTDIDLLIGGSPCQGFSFAGKQLAFDDPRSNLFFEFVRLLKECKPKYFLLENVRMKKEYLDIISTMLGVDPIKINSSLVSAQNRVRYYWTNIPGVEQPEDKQILLANIIEYIPFTKSYMSYNPRDTKNYVQFDVSGKDYKSQQDRAYFIDRKFGCFPNARAITKRKITDGCGNYRDLILKECERLQTIPDGYTNISENFSLNKSLHCLGNGWTVDVIAHIFKGLK